MKNRLKGLTLLETVLYIGLFSVIILLVLNFMLSTQEATLRTQRRSSLNQTSEFVVQHLTDTFQNASVIVPETSIFLNDIGKLDIVVNSETKIYQLQDSTLLYNNIPISPKNVLVESFYLEALNADNGDTIGVRANIQFRSLGDSNLTQTTNLLFIIR